MVNFSRRLNLKIVNVVRYHLAIQLSVWHSAMKYISGTKMVCV